MHVFVTGGTGLIGSRLVRELRGRQTEVSVLTRRPGVARDQLPPGCTVIEGNPMTPGAWMDAVGGCDAVINLAGESIFGRRWNEEYKALLRDSRVKTTEHVVQALARNPRATSGEAKVLVNASAIGYYGPHGDEEVTEEAPPADDTLARVTVDWERAARAAEGQGIRVALIRIGVVLDRGGAALAKMITPFKIGIGGPVGSGRQWMSWIHPADMVGILLLALDNPSAAGPVNGTAPNPVTNKEFARALGRALHRPAFVPVPAFALRLRFGQVAEVLTTGQRVLPRRALALGYSFRFPDVDATLRDVLAS
ncbi:MAG TPA: TIGR01777 family oxidoreductase [Gemmataceae bacterium]|jgi:hypothetical protein|nr:TIGR01777 family oxidoreductase [Gemmataceae bacterium]